MNDDHGDDMELAGVPTPAQEFANLPHVLAMHTLVELISEFDRAVRAVGLERAVTDLEEMAGWMCRVQTGVPGGCTRNHTFILVHVGETDKLGTAGFEECEYPFGPPPGAGDAASKAVS